MGVHVDKAGRHQLALGVDLFLGPGGDLADLADAPAADGNIASKRSPPLPSAMVPPRMTRSGASVMALHPF
jgi:hypothetical protein